jgi:hypothetical protein
MGMRIHGGQSNWAVQSQTVGDWQQRQSGIKNIKSALASNDLAGAQQAFDSMNIDPSKLSSTSPLGKLGAALKAGDINAAQQAAQGLGHRHQHGQEVQTANATEAASDPGFMQLVAQSLATTLNNTQPKSVSTSDSSQATQAINSAQNVSQKLSAFMQQLMTALEPKNEPGNGSVSSNSGQDAGASQAVAPLGDSDGDNDGAKFQQALTSANAFQGPPSPKFNNYMQAMGGQMKSNLDNLLQHLSGNSTGDNSSATALQNSFSSFIGALGGQADNSTLTSFLQNMQKNLQYGSTTGNLLNISA